MNAFQRVTAERPDLITLELGVDCYGSVEEVVNLSATEIELTPECGTAIDASCLLGMAKVKGQVTMLLDLDRVVAAETLRTLAQAAP